jgi:2-dehydro-3-deoxy-D-arabinonate dehydratase
VNETPTRICRYEHEGEPLIGVLDGDGGARRIDASSLAELLALPAAEARRRIDAAVAGAPERPHRLLPIADRQEIWAAGVTYERSKEARVAESGLVDVYTRAYEADRPELFFKAPADRVVAPGGAGRLRADSTWDACEPELAVVVNAHAEIVGYTIGNDLCSRSIEAENPLYLPQAKSYTDSCLLAATWTPAWCWDELGRAQIRMRLLRARQTLWEGSVGIGRLRRRPAELVSWLFRELEFPHGVVLLTGTGLVAPDDVVLADGDDVEIGIDGLGELRHPLYRGPAVS